MAAEFVIEWDQAGEKMFETGVDRGVLYTQSSTGTYPSGVAWNGLTGVTESPSGAETTALWADNTKYLNLVSAEEFGGTIEAYMYPDEFKPCIGEEELVEGITVGQQKRKPFGLSYRTKIGSDTQGNDAGYKIHLVYGCSASTSERAYSSVNDSPEAITFSYEFSTTPVNVTGKKPTSLIVIDSTKVDATKLAAFEKILYGTPATTEGGQDVAPKLPLPDDVYTHFSAN